MASSSIDDIRSRSWAVWPTGSLPSGCIGSPTLNEIVLPREKSRGWSLVIIRWVPQRMTGTIGTPASAAIRTAPVLNSLRSIEREMVASGKIPTASPCCRKSTAVRKEARPSPRSTSMWCSERISGPPSGWSKISRLAMNRTRRPEGFAASPP